MWDQIAIGAALIVITIALAAFGFMLMEAALIRARRFLFKPPFRTKLFVLLVLVVLWILLVATSGVWLWAAVFVWLDLFATWEAAVYFALVTFTTLGFGDVLLPLEWRLLSGMAAINGLLIIGLQTAMLIELLRQVRRFQNEADYAT